MTAPMTKWSGAVHSAERLPELARQAFRASWAGRPGVVHLDVPENIMNGPFTFPPDAVRKPASYRPIAPPAADAEQVRAAAELAGAHEFISALLEDRDPWPNAVQSANWTCVGICAHESSLKGGEIVARGVQAGPTVARTMRAVEARWVEEGFPDRARVEVTKLRSSGNNLTYEP